jgi:hypothetical protein
VPPAGFEPALTAPEGVSPSAADQRKPARGRPFWTRIEHGADNRWSRPCRSPIVFHKPGSDRRVSLTLHPIYCAGCGGDSVRHEDARAGDKARIALGRRLAIMRHDARALNSIQFRSAAAATSQPGRAGPLSWPWASPRVSSPLVLMPSGFIQLPTLGGVD